METKLKPFDLEAAKNGAKVVTRYGRPARIICWDYHSGIIDYHIVACVDRQELLYVYTNKGECYHGMTAYDLFMAPVKREGWVNLYRSKNGDIYPSPIYNTKDEAIASKRGVYHYIDTLKLEWEE